MSEADASELLQPVIYNVTLTSADTEYSQALSADMRYFSVQCRTAFDVRYAFVTGKVATPTAPYATIKSGNWYNSPEKLQLDIDGETIYLASAEAGVIVEIVAWTPV